MLYVRHQLQVGMPHQFFYHSAFVHSVPARPHRNSNALPELERRAGMGPFELRTAHDLRSLCCANLSADPRPVFVRRGSLQFSEAACIGQSKW
jgi:hypothetical protein